MPSLYPLSFIPIYKEKIWGGQKIRDVLGKDFGTLENCGESWEISGIDGDVSIVASGPLREMSLKELIGTYKEQLVGKYVYEKFGTEFPLLIKFIDANADLSVQVHPNDQLASERHHSLGKSEMWYILQADPKSTLISGFNRPLTKEEYLSYFNSGKIMDILNSDEVSAGDVYFLPAGRVHTIGKGLLLAEIQQSSDVTYRIYDFGRKDKNGNLRELHTEEALDALDFTYHDSYKTSYVLDDVKSSLVSCQYFETNMISASGVYIQDLIGRDSFTALIAVEGSSTLRYHNDEIPFTKGASLLLPANINEIEISSKEPFKYLETYIPN